MTEALRLAVTSSDAPYFEGRPDLAVEVAFLDGLFLFVDLLALAQGDFDFDQALVVEDDLERDQGQAALLDFAGQALDLPAVEKELRGRGAGRGSSGWPLRRDGYGSRRGRFPRRGCRRSFPSG